MPSGPLGRPSDAFWMLMTVLDLGGLALGAWLLWGRLWTAERLREFRILFALVAGLTLIATILGPWLTHSSFGALRLWCHILFCVLAPLLMVRGAFIRGRLGIFMLVLGLGMDLTYLYAREVEPFNLQIRRYDAVTPAWTARPLKIGVVADLQTASPGAYEESAFDRIDEERPDLLLFAGDYLQVMSDEEYAREQPRLIALFQHLRHRPPLGMYAIHGDVDWTPDSLDGSGVQMLEEQTVHVPGVPLRIIGLANAWRRSAVPMKYLTPFSGVTIVLAHRPDFAADFLENGVDAAVGPMLCIAGHTHGGQIVVPGFGPPMTLSQLPRQYAGGFHLLGRRGGEGPGGWLAVSRGVGLEREYAPRLRLFCPPELVMITLRGTR